LRGDRGVKRISKVAKALKPAEDYQSSLASFSEALKEYELSTRDLECAASIIQPQEKYPLSASPGMSAQKQMAMPRTTASTARFLYLEFAAEIRAMASFFVRRMKGDITDIDFAEQAAKVSVNLHDILRELFSLSPAVTLVLINPEPDSANKMSRLHIPAKEREDLIDMLDQAFGKNSLTRQNAINVLLRQSPPYCDSGSPKETLPRYPDRLPTIPLPPCL
jgi:hypothetical protein